MTFNKIPIFFHVPRCAGTYTIQIGICLLRYLMRILKQKNRNFFNPQIEYRRNLVILNEDHIVARILAIDPFLITHQHKFEKSKTDPTTYFIDLRNINSQILEKLIYFMIVIEPQGFKMYQQIFEKILQPQLKYIKFLFLREPYSHAISMFYYLQNNISKHEKTYQAFNDLSLEQYLTSNHIPDSWLIRQLNNLEDNQIINNDIFDKTKNILTNFKIFDIKKVDAVLDNIFSECFELKKENGIFFEGELTKKNNINYKNITTISNDVLKIFNKRVGWDKELYQKYCE